ncbi:MAG: hypothetical protein IJW17_11075, partial [Lentisphaeria bacterium]|nr:hypothetical protein [Lentisphaeria bacterium]
PHFNIFSVIMQVSSSHVSTDKNIQKRKKIWNNNQKSNRKTICNIPFLSGSGIFPLHRIIQWEPSARQSPPDKNVIYSLQKKQADKPGDPCRNKRPEGI